MYKHSWLASVTLVCALAAVEEAEARTMEVTRLTRTSRDVYKTPDGEVVRTRGCTNSADGQLAIVDRNDPHSRVYFLDEHGEVEDECHLRVTRVRR